MNNSYFKGISNNNYESYLGIRYANPPLGSLRFAPPTPYTYENNKWYDSTKFGSACLQNDSAIVNVIPDFNFDITNQSEDCLFLNVYRPVMNTSSAYPVMVFIHGGSFVFGSSSQNQYIADNMMNSSQVIVVTLNYRLGPLGFISLSDYGIDNANFGIMDQILALKWVQNNIGSFGGDPSKVTIFGESAGAISVCLHLMIEESYPLYQNIIIESGSCAQIGFFPSVYKSTKQTKDLLSKVSCTSVECLRTISANDIINALPNFQDLKGYLWVPIVDKVLLIDQPRTLIKNENFNRNANMIIGNNMKGGSIFVPSWSMGVVEYTTIMYETFGAYANEIGPVYPIWDYPSPSPPNTYSQILTDMFFYCPSRTLSSYLSKYSNVYFYVFDHEPSWNQNPDFGCYHTSELPFVFERTPQPNITFSSVEFSLAKKMSSLWKNFAIYSNPNGNGDSLWSNWTNSHKYNLQISASEFKMADNFRSTFCDFWDTLIDEICLQLPCRCDGDC